MSLAKKKNEKETGKREIPQKIFVFFVKIFKVLLSHPLTLGIDISDHSIEVLGLDPEKNIKVYGRAVLEDGIVENGNIKDAKKLGEVFQKTLENVKPEPLKKKNNGRIKAVFSLPESRTFIKELEFYSRHDLEENIKKSIEKNIPLVFESLYWDYIELDGNVNGPEEKIRVLAVAIPGDVVDQYVYFFWINGIDPIAFDIEAASIGRALLSPKKQKESVAIVDIGARTSVINIFNQKGNLAMSSSLLYAGNYFTREISHELKISQNEAEKIKQEMGLAKEPVAPILEKCLSFLIEEIKDALGYYQGKFGDEVGKIILAGGSTLLPGIEEYFQKNTKKSVEIGNSLLNIKKTSLLPEKRAILFANVIGLAIRGISSNPADSGINLLLEKIKRRQKTLLSERKRFFLFVFIFVISLLFLLLTILFLA